MRIFSDSRSSTSCSERLRYYPANQFASQPFVNVQTHVGQLQADVGVQALGGDGGENVLIEMGAVPGFFGIGNVFAEVVDRHAHTRVVDRLGGADRVGDFGSCDETP